MDYSSIFNNYTTTEGIKFTLKNRCVRFPEDKTLPIYGKVHIGTNTPWTILSYNLYGTIEHWWILSTLNPHMVFYATAGNDIYYIKKDVIGDILSTIQESNV